MLADLVVCGDGRIGRALVGRLNCPSTSRRLPTATDRIYFDLLSDVTMLPVARMTYFAVGMTRFIDCEQNPEMAFRTNVLGVVRAAMQQVSRGQRVVLLSSSAAETRMNTCYGRLSRECERRFRTDFGDQAAVYRFGPVVTDDRSYYADGPFWPLALADLVTTLTGGFVAGLHRLLYLAPARLVA